MLVTIRAFKKTTLNKLYCTIKYVLSVELNVFLLALRYSCLIIKVSESRKMLTVFAQH